MSSRIQALLELLAQCSEGERAPAAPPAATALSRGREGEDAALFVANPGAREERVSLDEGWCAARAARLWDGISGTPVDPQRIELAPQQVRLLRCREEARRR